jgi:hypothetical protein
MKSENDSPPATGTAAAVMVEKDAEDATATTTDAVLES